MHGCPETATPGSAAFWERRLPGQPGSERHSQRHSAASIDEPSRAFSLAEISPKGVCAACPKTTVARPPPLAGRQCDILALLLSKRR